MTNTEQCPVCENSATLGLSGLDGKQYSCKQCGDYQISGTALAMLPQHPKKHLISNYLRKQTDVGSPALITTADLSRIEAMPEMPLAEKVNTLLLAFADSLQNYADLVDFTNPRYIATIAAKSEQDYLYIMGILHDRGLITGAMMKTYGGPTFGNVQVAPETLIQIESYRKAKDTTQGFVAMSFAPELTSAWQKGIMPAFEGTGFSPLRIDTKEHNDKIDDQIIAEIQRSRFVVADFTGHRGGVYFEAGYALGRGIPVIWTCRKDDLSNLHFDIRQYNTIDWANEEDLKHRLHQRITNPTIADVYQFIDEGKLILQPDFQRRFVWTHDHQQSFIDTVLNGLPFPEIYVCEGEVNIQKMRTTRNVIDGQQRLTTIRNYIEGTQEYPLTKIPSYQSLTDAQKQDFLSYQIVMRDLGKIDEATTREIFRRINLTKFKLDDVEIHNAVYDGHFIQAAKTILENIALEEYGVLRESEFTRMADLHFILLVMATVESGGYFAQDREVEPKVSEFNEEYPNKEHTIALLIRVFATIRDLELPLDSMWFRKSNFFTLVVEMAANIDKLPADLKNRLLALEENVMKNRMNTNSEFYKYYSYMYQATHGRTARVVRGEYFQRYCL